MASCNAVLKSESKYELRQVSNSAQTQHFSSLELLLDSYMPEMALSSKHLPIQRTCISTTAEIDKTALMDSYDTY